MKYDAVTHCYFELYFASKYTFAIALNVQFLNVRDKFYHPKCIRAYCSHLWLTRNLTSIEYTNTREPRIYRLSTSNVSQLLGIRFNPITSLQNLLIEVWKKKNNRPRSYRNLIRFVILSRGNGGGNGECNSGMGRRGEKSWRKECQRGFLKASGVSTLHRGFDTGCDIRSGSESRRIQVEREKRRRSAFTPAVCIVLQPSLQPSLSRFSRLLWWNERLYLDHGPHLCTYALMP